MQLQMDLGQTGLLMFFKPYQLKALQALWKGTPMNSRQVWEAIGKNEISRASVINFLAAAVEAGLLEVNHISGKGGYRGIYAAKYDEVGTKAYLKRIFKDQLDKL